MSEWVNLWLLERLSPLKIYRKNWLPRLSNLIRAHKISFFVIILRSCSENSCLKSLYIKHYYVSESVKFCLSTYSQEVHLLHGQLGHGVGYGGQERFWRPTTKQIGSPKKIGGRKRRKKLAATTKLFPLMTRSCKGCTEKNLTKWNYDFARSRLHHIENFETLTLRPIINGVYGG